jgi:diaminopimelate decarboxylase
VVAARYGDEPRPGRPQVPRQLAGALDGDPLVAFGVQEQDRDVQSGGGLVGVVRGEQRVEGGNVGAEGDVAACEPPAELLGPGRTDRHDRPRRDALGGDEREVAAHARAAQRPRARGQELGHGGDVIQRARVESAGALAVSALIEAQRGEARRPARARERVVALLARAGSVEHEHGAARSFGSPEGVGEPLVDARVVGRRGGDGAHLWHDRAAMAIIALSDAFPLDSYVNGRDHLEVGGCDAVELAAEFGTPAYVVAEEDLRSRARAFAGALAERHGDGEVLFASKAFPCTAVYRVFAQEGLSCDVASGGELRMALRAGFDPARIYLHGNAKGEDEVRLALETGVGCIVVDSEDDVLRLERLVGDGGRSQDVLLRVTPGVEADTHHAVHTGHAGSKFGVRLSDAPAIIDRLGASSSLDLRGLHMHIGSQLFDLEPFRAGIAALAALGDFEVIDVGGGLAATYASDEPAPEPGTWVADVAGAVRDLLGPGRRLLLEPGRALVANACVTLYAVQTVKRNASTWVAVDGGMSDNLRPMLYDARYVALLANRMLGGERSERCRVAGKHCESGDVIVGEAMLSDPRPGDLVVTPATGAYGHALANNYNGVPRPPVVFCAGGDARLVVRRETFDDLVARDVD